jgi:hypothetical protein
MPRLLICCQAFVIVQKVQKTSYFKNTLSSTHQHQKKRQHLKHVMTVIHGGSQPDAAPGSHAGTAVTALIASSIGTLRCLGVDALASAILLSLTQIRNTYVISVGYEATVAAIAMALRNTIGVIPAGSEDVLWKMF